jgi:hypothetical protein
MVAPATNEAVQTLCLERDVLIAAPIDLAFEALLEQLGPANEVTGGKAMPMVLEPWPGGRWFRNLGNNSGHFWAHVQVIKPPSLLEFSGPLFMSYACMNHVQYRLAAEGTGTRLKLVHRAIGEISSEHRDGIREGWHHGLNLIRQLAESRLKSK